METNQRPFHICPECSAYNAKANETCWRCQYDFTKGSVEPSGVTGYRLDELDDAKPSKAEKKESE